MNTFVDSIKESNKTKTTNGMKAKVSTKNACVDLFFKAGAMRGQNIFPCFTQALNEDKEIALKISMWLRDVRGGAGERQLFKDILSYLEIKDVESAKILTQKIPLLGRWDDGMVLQTTELKNLYMDMIKTALENGDGLCAKWMPRKGKFALELRNFLGYSPKRYRKTLVNLSETVEQKMCANKWTEIEFGKVPSLAHIRNRKAFIKHTPDLYSDYVASLSGDAPTGKINAGAIYPHDIVSQLEPMVVGYRSVNNHIAEKEMLIAQWNALPNYLNDSKILPMVDVSGSMECPIGTAKRTNGVTCMDVAVSLGLYISEKQPSEFKDVVMTFSSNPHLMKLNGGLDERLKKIHGMDWGMSTNLELTFEKLLGFAQKNKVLAQDMPEFVLILSDMQFDRCVHKSQTAFKMIEKKYEASGYVMPKIVFWNIHANENVPVVFDKDNTALVSGFSPSILKAVLSDNLDSFSPISVMMETLSNPRYEV